MACIKSELARVFKGTTITIRNANTNRKTLYIREDGQIMEKLKINVS